MKLICSVILLFLSSCSLTSTNRFPASSKVGDCLKSFNTLSSLDYNNFKFHKYIKTKMKMKPFRIVKNEKGEELVSLITTRTYESEKYVTEVTNVDWARHNDAFRRKNKHFFKKGAFEKNHAIYLKKVEEIIDFSLEQFKRRDWPEDFTKKMHKTAKDYILQSSYISVRDKESGKLIGSMRLIYSDYQIENGVTDRLGHMTNMKMNKLPVEGFLDLEVPMPSVELPFSRPGLKEEIGQIVEPGTFAIDQDYNNDVFGEIWIHMLARLLGGDPMSTIIEQADSRMLYTYGDRASRFLYERQMGFSPMFEKNELVERLGINWQVWKFTSGDIINAIIKRNSMSQQQLREVLDNIRMVGLEYQD